MEDKSIQWCRAVWSRGELTSTERTEDFPCCGSYDNTFIEEVVMCDCIEPKEIHLHVDNPNEDVSPVMVYLSIPASPNYWVVARLVVSGIGAFLALTYEDIDDLKISLTEALSNAIEHGYRDSGKEGRVAIVFSIEDDRITVSVVDRGKGFDIAAMALEEDENALSSSEFGLFLMKNLSDKLEIQSSVDMGTKVVIVKSGDLSTTSI